MVRIGVMVFFYHDISDIFLEFAKLLKYTKVNNKGLLTRVDSVCVCVCVCVYK